MPAKDGQVGQNVSQYSLHAPCPNKARERSSPRHQVMKCHQLSRLTHRKRTLLWQWSALMSDWQSLEYSRTWVFLSLPSPHISISIDISSHSSRCLGQRNLLKVSTGRRDCSVLSCGRSYLLPLFLLLFNSTFLVLHFFIVGFHMVVNYYWMLPLTNSVLAECILSH